MPTLLITGASTGIGAATARQAVAAGWNVVLSARSEDKLRALSDELGAERTHVVRCDVTDWDDQQRLAAEAIERFGRIDAAFANAGFGAKRGFLEEDPEFWRSMVVVNVLGVDYTIRATMSQIRERGSGHYLITISVAGRRALHGSLYSATKWAVTGMAESLRQELRAAESKVRVTVI